MKETFWCGEGPKVCQICDRPITDSFVDGKTQWDCWAFMCRDCWEMHGEGLGTGLGQMYGRMEDGRWKKVTFPTAKFDDNAVVALVNGEWVQVNTLSDAEVDRLNGFDTEAR